ncbi:MAG TPA: hypothetical protein VGM92_08515, partial [Candidatus Kapabacteria bacterium]
MVDGTTYLEFPSQWAFVQSAGKIIGESQLITILKCDETKVALLPLLPFKPMFREHDIVDRTGFRRLPNLRIENVLLEIGASTGVSSITGNDFHGSIGFAFGFSSTDRASIPLTSIFPRSLKCMQNHVPLIPVLEVLPWDPNNVNSLVETARRVNQIRDIYPQHSISLDLLRRILLDDDSEYGALLDFVRYSLMYEMFDGNVFSLMRAHLGNTMCALVDSHTGAFEGPFEALPENFTRRFVAQLGANIRQVAPACRISEGAILAYKRSASPNKELMPFDVTFRKCLNATTSMAQCLAKDDSPISGTNCDAVTCDPSKPSRASDEVLLEDYDDTFFSSLIAAKNGRLLEIHSIKPNECPDFRDGEENRHFVDWWLDQANKIVEEPADCTSQTWRSDYNRSQEEIRDTLACASKRGIPGPRYEKGAFDLSSFIYATKCKEALDVNKAAVLNRLSNFFDQIDSVIARLKGYSDVIGDAESQSLIAALQLFSSTKENICGGSDFRTCVD